MDLPANRADGATDISRAVNGDDFGPKARGRRTDFHQRLSNDFCRRSSLEVANIVDFVGWVQTLTSSVLLRRHFRFQEPECCVVIQRKFDPC